MSTLPNTFSSSTTSTGTHSSSMNSNSSHHQFHHEGDKVNISEWIAHAIADTGCEVVYGGHGGALVPLVNAVCAHPKLTWVCARTEHDAATMAAAHAKLTGGLGVVIATSGPGATNLTTGLMEAAMDKVSVLAITGMKPTAQLGYAEFQDVNQSRLFAGAGMEWSKDAASPHAVCVRLCVMCDGVYVMCIYAMCVCMRCLGKELLSHILIGFFYSHCLVHGHNVAQYNM